MKACAVSSNKATSIVVVFVLLLFSDNPIVTLTGAPVIFLFLIFSVSVWLGRGFPALRQMEVLVLVGSYLLTTGITSLHHHTHVPFVFAVLTIVYYLTTTSLSRIEVVAIIELSTKILFWTCSLAVISLIFAIAHPMPLFKIGVLEFHYFSLMYPNTPFMRPTGFMHEPGQLSFYICAIVAARELLQLHRHRSLALLVLGLSTQSLAHIIFLGAFFLYIALTSDGGKMRRRAIITTIALLLPFVVTGLLNWAAQRAANFYENPEEWGRFLSFNNVLNLLDDSMHNYFYGPSSSLASRTLDNEDMFSSEFEGVSIYGENPLSPLVFGGILASWPYYLFIALSMVTAIKRARVYMPLLMCAFLTLQRPYTLEFPYAIALALLIYCARINYLRSRIQSDHSHA